MPRSSLARFRPDHHISLGAVRFHVVGHTDNQGRAEYNLDLSRRRAANVVAQLAGNFGISAARLDAFGCGLYAPLASNEAEVGRAKLVSQVVARLWPTLSHFV